MCKYILEIFFEKFQRCALVVKYPKIMRPNEHNNVLRTHNTEIVEYTNYLILHAH